MYKERSQPQKRKKFGFLEKHKDYVKRAAAYNKRKNELKRLRILARDKNPDEFNYRMIGEVKRRNLDHEENIDYKSKIHEYNCDLFNFRAEKRKVQKELEEAVIQLSINSSSTSAKSKKQKMKKIKEKVSRLEKKIEEINDQIKDTELQCTIAKAKFRKETYFEIRDNNTGEVTYKWKQERNA